jgi:hypothetical protein
MDIHAVGIRFLWIRWPAGREEGGDVLKFIW